MAKAAKAVVETKLHDDGAVSHKFVFTDGDTRTIVIPKGHSLTQQYVAAGSKSKYLAAINSVDEIDKAKRKVDELEKAHDQGKWSLIVEGDGLGKYTLLTRAFAEVRGVELDVADGYIKGLGRAEQAKLRKHEKIATVIARLEGDETADDLLNVALVATNHSKAA